MAYPDLNLTTYGSPATFQGDVSGFTITINPLSQGYLWDLSGSDYALCCNYGPPPGTYMSGDNPPITQTAWTASLFNPGIHPYLAYTTGTSTIDVSLVGTLLAQTPIFWALNISEVTNPRLQALLDSNNSGWGHDVRFWLEGYNGRHDGVGDGATTNQNTNNSRTNNVLFTSVNDAYFSTANASIYTSSTIINYTSPTSAGNVPQTFAMALNPWGYMNDGAGNSTIFTNYTPSGTNTSRDRVTSRLFVSKHPTLGYANGNWNDGPYNDGAPFVSPVNFIKDKFNLGCEIYNSSNAAWEPAGLIQSVVSYRTSASYWQSMGDDNLSFPSTETHLGAYIINGMGTSQKHMRIQNALTFTWAAPVGTVPGTDDDNVNDYGWENAFTATGLPTEKTDGFPTFAGHWQTAAGSASSGTGSYSGQYLNMPSTVYSLANDSFLPARLGGFTQYRMSSGLYDSSYSLATGIARNWEVTIDTNQNSGSAFSNTAIFGYKQSQATNIGHTNASLRNWAPDQVAGAADKLKHVDHRQFWFAFSPILTHGAATINQNNIGTLSVPQSSEPVAQNATSYIVNQPICGNKTEWMANLIDVEYIPAPIIDTNLFQHLFLRVQPGNTWNGGISQLLFFYRTQATASSTPTAIVETILTTTTWHQINQEPAVTAKNCYPRHYLAFMEPKSVCTIDTGRDGLPSQAQALIGLTSLTFSSTIPTCTTSGFMTVGITWDRPCHPTNMPLPATYQFSIKFKVQHSSGTIETGTFIIDQNNINNLSMTVSPGLPCGQYSFHSIECTAVTSTSYTSGNTGDSHTWTPNAISGTGPGGLTYAPTTFNLPCVTNVLNLSVVTTVATCNIGGTAVISYTNGPITNVLLSDNLTPTTNITGLNQIVGTGGTVSYGTNGNTSNLPAGTYTFSATTAGNCIETISFTIAGTGGITSVVAVPTAPTFCTLSDGTITLTITGGQAPYTTGWVKQGWPNAPITPFGTYSATYAHSLPPGSYLYLVTDANGCLFSGVVAVNPAANSGLSCGTIPLTYISPSGPAASDGSITVDLVSTAPAGTFANGSTTLNNISMTLYFHGNNIGNAGTVVSVNSTYAGWGNILQPPTAPSYTFNNLVAGFYSVVSQITPHTMDLTASNILISATNTCSITCYPPQLVAGSGTTLTVGTVVNNSCTSSSNNIGSISVTAVASSANTSSFHHYVYTLCTNLAMTTGCQTFAGTSTYGNPATGNTHTFTGLVGGTYYLTVTPFYGPTGATSQTSSPVSTVLVGGGDPFTVAVSYSDQSCAVPLVNDGTLQVVVSALGNTPDPPYIYSWTGPGGYSNTEFSNFTTSSLLTGLAAGTYNLTVTDVNLCSATATQIISPYTPTGNLVVTELSSLCPIGCGNISISNTTGDFPLWIEISSDGGATWTKVSTNSNSAATGFTSIDLAPPLGVQITPTTYFEENSNDNWCFLQDGSTYHVRTTGINPPNCSSAIVPITMSIGVYVPMVFTETIVQPTCCGCNNILCNGSITAIVSGGAPLPQGVAGTLMSYDWILTFDGVQIGSQVGTVVTGAGSVSSTFSTPTNQQFNEITFDDLFPGTYEFTTRDACGTSISETWVIIDPKVYVIDIVPSQPLCAFGCDDGTITVTASGGTSGTYQFSMDDGLTWEPSVASTLTSYTFTGVGQGLWNIWARDPVCGTQILFDPTDNVLTSSPGCYSDFIAGIWPIGTQSSIMPISDLNTQFVSLTNNSLPGSSDGALTFDILGGVGPYEIAVSTSATLVACNNCALQTAGVITPGLAQYININGVNVSNTGITTVVNNGQVIIDNLSVTLDYNNTALGAFYTVYVKDSVGCFSCISKYIDNGTLGIIAIYTAEDCNCSCPTGYALIDPPPALPALPCAGLTPDAPIFLGTLNAPYTIQQFGAANLTNGLYGLNGGRLYVPAGSNSTSITAITTAETLTRDALGLIAGFPGRFVNAASGTVLEVALDGGGSVQGYGSIFDTRLWDIGIWPQQGASSPALPTNEWIGIPIEISFGGPQLCILGIASDGDFKVTLDCATLIGPTVQQTTGVDSLNYQEYAMIPILIQEGQHTLTFWVRNNTANASPDQIAGIAFDLFQGTLNTGLSTTSVFVGANNQAALDPYYILDAAGKKITSRNLTANLYEHNFLMGTTIGYECPSNCVIMEQGNITCLSADTALCTLPINCPEFLADLVECLGTLSNEVYDKMLGGLLDNKLEVREIWLVVFTKYLMKNLNPCITIQDLLSWAKFLEDICPDCINNFEGTRKVPEVVITPTTPNTYDF